MTEYQRNQFAGFWLRFVALIIDSIIVSFIVFPFALIIGLALPNVLLVEVPFGLFTTTDVVIEHLESNETIEKEDVLGLWENFYKVTKKTSGSDVTTREKILINPNTKRPIEKTTSSDIETIVIFIYWILFESSVWQASIGKKIMGLKVVSPNGSRPTINQAMARNILKLLSAMTLFIGFMMVGWTDKKQGLHDKVSKMFVIKEFSKPLREIKNVGKENITSVSTLFFSGFFRRP